MGKRKTEEITEAREILWSFYIKEGSNLDENQIHQIGEAIKLLNKYIRGEK